MKARKMVAAVACAALLVVGSVAATLAYFTDVESATNTFTVGKVEITLDEAKVNTAGETIDADGGEIAIGDAPRVASNMYHLIPGHTYVKDPTVTVKAGSEESYVRMMVKVENIDALKAAMPVSDADFASYYNGGVFLLQNLCLNEGGVCTWDPEIWVFKGFDDKTATYEFRYKEVVTKSAEDIVLPDLFTHITVPGEIDNDQLEKLKDVKITVTAHAIQAEGFDNADTAWGAFDAQHTQQS